MRPLACLTSYHSDIYTYCVLQTNNTKAASVLHDVTDFTSLCPLSLVVFGSLTRVCVARVHRSTLCEAARSMPFACDIQHKYKSCK